jgi:hypothetical protein
MAGIAPRMHIRGDAMTLTRERASATTCLADFPNWNFYNQQVFRAVSRTVLEPGDTLHISCTYDTQGRTDPVMFGDAIDDEECVAYLFVTGC